MAFVDGENGENFMSEILGLPQFGKSDTRKQVKDLNKFGMDYEQKYKDTLDLAKTFYEGYIIQGHDGEAGILAELFPELKKNRDEIIRKGIIGYVKKESEIYGIKTWCGGYTTEEIIAWLDRQSD